MSDETDINNILDTREKEEMRKIFIGGLNRSTKAEDFIPHFEKYGDILDKVVIQDRDTGNSKGYGFITFSESKSVEEVLQDNPHEIDGKKLDIKRATPKAWTSDQAKRSNKLFIGGLLPETTPDDITDYIMSRHEGYVRIDKVDILKDKETGKNKSFGFFYVDTEDMADRLAICEEKFEIGGKEMSIKKAIPKSDNNQGNSRGGNSRGGGSFRGYNKSDVSTYGGPGSYGGMGAAFGGFGAGRSSYTTGYGGFGAVGAYGQSSGGYGQSFRGGYGYGGRR